MQMKIFFAAGLFFAGWLWVYLFVRQFLFNVMTAYPLIRKMQSIDPDLIAAGARRYTNISVAVCLVISAVILFIILYFCPLYLIISFGAGALLCLMLLLNKLGPTNKGMFESFCTGYCRFVPDDELRTLMYQRDIKKIDRRLREMGLGQSFVPEFKN